MIHLFSYCDNILQPCGDFFKRQIKELYPQLLFSFRNYDVPENGQRTAHWNKVDMSLYVINQLDGDDKDNLWSIYIDCDSCVYDKVFHIQKIVDYFKRVQQHSPSVEFLVGQDWNGVCTAAFAFKHTRFCQDLFSSWWFLGDIYEQYDDQFGQGLGRKYEQNALKLMLKEFSGPSKDNKIAYLPKWFMSDNPEKEIDKPWFWHYGSANTPEKKIWILNNIIKNKKA